MHVIAKWLKNSFMMDFRIEFHWTFTQNMRTSVSTVAIFFSNEKYEYNSISAGALHKGNSISVNLLIARFFYSSFNFIWFSFTRNIMGNTHAFKSGANKIRNGKDSCRRQAFMFSDYFNGFDTFSGLLFLSNWIELNESKRKEFEHWIKTN